MMPVLYYVYRLAALHKFPHVEDLLAAYENGNELDGWIAYFQMEDERMLNRMKAAFATAKVSGPAPRPTKAPEKAPEQIIDMTDPKNQQSFLNFVTGAK